MSTGRKYLWFAAMLATIMWSLPTMSQVTVDPFGITVGLDDGDEETVELTLTNQGETDLTFEISLAKPPEEEERRQPGPRRDDLGDIVEEINMEQRLWTGLAWVDPLMWGVDYDGRLMVSLTGDREIEDRVNVDGNFTGMCWDGDAFWFGSFDDNRLFHVDRDGDGLGTINAGGGGEGVFGVAWDGESLWYIKAFGNRILYNISVEGDDIREVGCGNIEGADFASLVWVPEHEDGHMWLLGCEVQSIYQLNVEEDDADVVQQTRIDHMITG
ncbi:hypothetical protein HQ587_02130 [bacterium]|nr:hypothetical protein [bacterium]